MLELLLRVEASSGRAAELRVELADHHEVGALAAALASHLDVATSDLPPPLSCARLGGVVDAAATVHRTGLLSGDTVRLGGRSSAPDQAGPAVGVGLTLDVISGAASGLSLPLRPGRLTLGRDPGCDLVLDDATVSALHAVLDVDAAGGVQLEPLAEATNPLVLDGRPVADGIDLPRGGVLQLGACALTLRVTAAPADTSRDRLGQIPFNRTPYRHPDLRPVELRGPGRPPAPHEPRPLLLAALLLPLVGGIVFAWWLRRPEFLLFLALSPLAMVATWWSERRRGGTTHRQQVATFEHSLADWLDRYDAALATERTRRTAAAPDVADLARRAELRSADLWSRARWSPGFLELRVGLGTLPARTTTPRPDGVDDDPDGRIAAAIDERAELDGVPVSLDLRERGVVAVHGPDVEVESVVASLVLQAAALHSPDDLVIVVGIAEGRSLAAWVHWLPHVRAVASPVAGDHLAVGREDVDALLWRVLAGIEDRDADAAPTVLLVLDEAVEADQQLVAAVLGSARDGGVVALWFGRHGALVPRQAAAILACPPAATGQRATLWSTDPAEPTRVVDPDRLAASAAPRVARVLAPVRDASSSSAAASIPRVTPLLETLGTADVDPAWVAGRWSAASSRSGLAAPVGVGAAGVVTVDLVEHGPHALIAGTSGAGKSELLQSLIASLVATHPPERLNLLFIDYKGGAASEVFERLPHTVGTVTNLSAGLAMRALVSLRAELDRRMRLLEGRAKDLLELRERHPADAPPNLVIVVDEFATLVKEIPDFVAGMVDIAQRGRSLGIHLVLATQRPTGAVNDDILANTNLRMSLRVLDPGDSSNILGAPDAAAIPAPLRGRAFARLGAGGLLEFQTAYAGAPFTAASGVTPVVVEDLPSSGRRTLAPAPVAPAADGDAAGSVPSHLDVLLDAVVAASAAGGHHRGRRPWLAELPRHLELGDVLAGAFGEVRDRVPGRDLVLGVVDVPAEQAQRPLVVDLEDAGGLLVFGTGGSGRTTVLRAAVGAAVRDGRPEDVQVHVLDFGGRALEALRDVPHVAAVAAGDDLEQVARILQHLRAEVARRQALLATARAQDLTALNAQRPGDPIPRLLLVVDGCEAFERTFDRGELYVWSELLTETVLAGRSVGIHLIATASRRAGVPTTLSAAVSGRLVLRTADVDGLIDLGIPAAIARDAELGDGRALLPDGTVVQVAMVGPDPSAGGQAAAIAEFAGRTAGQLRASLPALPDRVEVASLPAASSATSVTLGLADLTLDPVVCDLRLQHLTVVGPGESGRSTALATAARALQRAGRQVHVLADPAGPLADGPWASLATKRGGHRLVLESLGGAQTNGGEPPVLVIDRAEQVADDATLALEQLVREDAVRLLVGVDTTTLSGYVSGWMTALKSSRRMLILQPDDPSELATITPVRIRLRPNQPLPPGRGVFVDGRRWQLVQVAC